MAVGLTDEIFVALVGEGVDVWRPVWAERLSGDTYRISAQPYDRHIEVWEFEPGDEVIVEAIVSSGGSILAATREADPDESESDENRSATE